MLAEFTLRDFKSFREARLRLGPLTVLIGANAAGKSNAIEALRLLSWLAQGQKLSAIQHSVNNGDRVVRGRVEDLCRRGETTFGLGCKTKGYSWPELSMELTVRHGELHITSERLEEDGASRVPLYTLDRPAEGRSTDAGVAYNNFARGGNKPHVTVSDQLAVFAQLGSPVSFPPNHKKARTLIPPAANWVQETLSSILFLDPVPARMRGYSFAADHHLLGDGTNLSSVLLQLWGHADSAREPYAAQRQAILDFIQSLPEQAISGLSFLSGPRGEVMVQLRETFGGTPRTYDASLLSDGTLRVLAIAAAMLSAPKDSLVVIEEIDNGVHPSRAHHLLQSIRSIAERRDLRVLLSTHNPALLDALPDAAVPDVVFCYRDPTTGESKLVRMSDIPDVPELLVQGSLGHLMTSGALDRFVKSYRGPEDRKQRAREWLHALKTAKRSAAG